MRKSEAYKKINRNSNSVFNHSNRVTPTNLMSSDIYVDHVWLHDDVITTGVQIVELKSSESDQTSDDEKDYNHQWSYATRQGDYKANETAREKRRNQHRNYTVPQMNEFLDTRNPYDEDLVYSDSFVSRTRDGHTENVTYNHQMNCFTIIDNHLLNSETSDEDEDVELIDCGEPIEEWNNYPSGYETNIITYNPESEHEKRTVWIYSFKNKRLLSDNEFELVNIPSCEASTSSIEDYQEAKPAHVRAATPIPPHIPRLQLPPTPVLPTVTEMNESGKLSSSNQTASFNSSNEKICLKSNNWFLSEHITPSSENVCKADKSTNIINWMALSPREKRRKFRNASPIVLPSDLISPLTSLKRATSHSKDNAEDSRSSEVIMENSEGSKSTERQLQSSSLNLQFVLDQTGMEHTSKRSIRTFRSNLSTPKENVSILHKIETMSDNDEQDRGDHNIRNIKTRAPRIKVSSRPISKKDVTDPIENLDSNDWIQESKIKDVNKPTDASGDIASDALWIRNMSLLKPAQWTEYLPITESIPSLHLTINTDSDTERQPWYRRAAKFFRCCK